MSRPSVYGVEVLDVKPTATGRNRIIARKDGVEYERFTKVHSEATRESEQIQRGDIVDLITDGRGSVIMVAKAKA